MPSVTSASPGSPAAGHALARLFRMPSLELSADSVSELRRLGNAAFKARTRCNPCVKVPALALETNTSVLTPLSARTGVSIPVRVRELHSSAVHGAARCSAFVQPCSDAPSPWGSAPGVYPQVLQLTATSTHVFREQRLAKMRH